MENWKKNFFIIWTGQAISQISSSVLQFAIIWYLTDMTKSPKVLSYAMLAGFLPRGILGLISGSFIDRFDRKKIIILSDILISLSCLLLFIVGSFSNISIYLILFVLVLRAMGSAFHNPCLNAITPTIVPEAELVKCNGYSQTLESVSLIVSPAIASFLYSKISLNIIILIEVIGTIIAIFTITISYIPVDKNKKNEMKFNFLKDSIEGVNIIKLNKGALILILVGALYTISMMPTSALFPLMSMDYFGGTSLNASFVEIIFSVGFMIGAIILSKYLYNSRKVNILILSCLIMTFSLFGVGLLPKTGFYLFSIFSFFMGLSGPFYWGMYNSILQQNFSSEYLGRVMSLSRSISFLTAPFCLSISGIFADIYGVENWFIVAGLLMFVITIIFVFSKEVKLIAERKIN